MDSNSKLIKTITARLRLKLLLVGLGLCLGLVIAEAALRLAGVQYALPYRPDAKCGTRLQANLSFRYNQEGHALVQINSHGQRASERSLTKPNGVRRIAVLGDSYCEAFQVDRQQAFFYQLHGFENTALGTGHWNANGHAKAAELIAEHLREQAARD